MTQEDKELLLILLKDLCARSPYGVIIYDNLHNMDLQIEWVNPINGIITGRNVSVPVEEVRPYLRPRSSMTKEEREELSLYDNDIQRSDFFYSHHIDCRYMIEKGLAQEAPEGMYDETSTKEI